MCAYHCAQLLYTTQHRIVLIISPLLSSRQSSLLEYYLLSRLRKKLQIKKDNSWI